MENLKKYVDLNGLGYTIRKINEKKADINSPALTGTPTAPNAAKNTANTQIATTKFVDDYFVKKSTNVLDTEIDTMLDEILDEEGNIIDPVTFSQLLARVEVLESKISKIDMTVEKNTLVFSIE